MAGKSAITLRLGAEGDEKIVAALKKIGETGDAAMQGLSKEARNAARDFDRLERSLDAQARSAAQVASTYVRANAAVAAGVRTQQEAQAVLDLATQRHLKLTGAVNDNAHAVGLARHEWINLSRQFQDVGVSLAGGQAPLTVLLQQGSQIADVFGSSQAGAAGALRSFGAGAVRALTSPIGVAAGLAAAVFGVKVAGDAAAESLAKLGEEARQTGLTPNRVAGAKIVGARAGLGDKEAVGAFSNAQKEFENYSRNSGQVKDLLEKVDKGFLKVADSARSSSEWIDRIIQKIRELPSAQGLNLAKALFGEDAGRKLFEEIQNGAVSMASLSKEAEKAGANFDASASNAERMKREIAEADRIASTKLLASFSALSDISLEIDSAWARAKGRVAGMADEIAELVRKARQMAEATDAHRMLAPMLQEEPPEAVAMRQLGLLPQGVAKSTAFASNPNFYADKAKFFPQLVNPTVGEERKLFESTKKGGSEKSAAERLADVEADLKNRIALAASEGTAHDEISLKIKIENEQRKLGTKATQEQKNEVADLVTQLDAAERAQKNATKAAEAWRDAMKEVGDTVKSVVNGLLSGESVSKSLANALKGIQGKAVDKGVDYLFGDGKKGGAGGLLSSLFGGSSSGGGLFSGAPFQFSFPGFPDGGLVSAPARHLFSAPLSAFAGAPHFADGGGIPAFLHAGEIVLNAAQQKNVAGSMAPAVTVHNYAAGVDVTPQMTPQGVALIVRNAIDANNRQNAEASWRGNRK